jgi:hypothetical protein
MVNYGNSKIYRVINLINLKTYIGGTTKDLKHRITEIINEHFLKLYVNNKECFFINDPLEFFSDIQETNFNDLKAVKNYLRIELIEDYPCDSKQELNERVKLYIDENECVNKNKIIKIIDKKLEYENKGKHWHKEYYQKNKEKIRERQKERYNKIVNTLKTIENNNNNDN